MASRFLVRRLMAGVAIASLSTAAFADSWTGLIVFGGRDYDTGQYVSPEAVFAEESEEIGDGRQRATNRIEGGSRGTVASQRVSDVLGYPALNPSQPQSYGDIPTPPDGWNYSALFYDSQDILDSITGTAITRTITYVDNNGDQVTVPGRSRPGLLNDPDRADAAWGALVLVGSAQRDLRRTADVALNLDDSVDLFNTQIELDSVALDTGARAAADNIATGVRALTDAGTGLVVVSNAYDAGAMPEVQGDVGRLADVDTALQAREDEAAAAEAAASTAEANGDPNAPALRSIANALALLPYEIALRAQVDAALADPTIFTTNRTAATDAYNTRLVDQLRANGGNVVLADQHALFEAVIADPSRFGLSDDFDQATDCVESSTLYPCNAVAGTVEQLLFVDGVNLTQAGHRLVGDQIVALIDAPAALSGAPAIGISAARGIADAGRDQVSREQSWKQGVAPFVSGVASRVQLNQATDLPQQDGGFYSGVVGIKAVPKPGFAGGFAVGYQKVTTPGDNSSMEYDGDAFFGTAFAGVNTGPLFGSVTATYGKLNLGEITRVSRIGGAEIRNAGNTDGTVYGVTGEAGLRLVQYDILRAGPIANVSHWTSKVDGYDESGWAATAVRTGDLETTSTRAGIGAFLEAGEMMNGFGSVFRAKVLYGHEFGDATETASVTPLGPNAVGSFSTQVRGVDSAPLEFGAEVVLGYHGVLTTFGYDGILGDVSDHRFRIGASMPL